jgi:hypothetical protein
MASNKIPNGALRLVQTGEGCHAFAEGEDGKKKLKMTVYSGGVIKNHWWWGNLAIDLTGMSFPKSKYPILENHDTSRKIAFTGKPLVGDDLTINPDKTKFVNTEESAEFQKLSAEGFPYESSMYAKPSAIERVGEGEKSEVNGFTFKGPGTIWRKCEFKEASVCVFGWDSQTVSSAFSKDILTEVEFEEMGGDTDNNANTLNNDTLNNETETLTTEEVKAVDINTLSEKHPDLLKKIQDDAVAAATSAFAIEKKTLEDKITSMEAENTGLGDKVMQLEKKDTLRDERERRATADAVWTRKLSESNIAEHLFDKIRSHVSHSKFMADGIFDVNAFSTAVDAEITDWETRGATTQVMGAGFTNKNSVDTEAQKQKQLAEQDDGIANNLLKLAGQKVA